MVDFTQSGLTPGALDRKPRKEPKPITPEQLAAAGTEHAHQSALFCWAAMNADKYPQLALLFAIPNGGERNVIVATKLKAEGVKKGMLDTFLAYPNAGWHGLFIELKRPKSEGKRKGVAQKKQSEWIVKLQTQGYGAMVCEGWIEARNAIVAYIEYK